MDPDPGSESGSEILDFQFEDSDPKLLISDPEHCSSSTLDRDSGITPDQDSGSNADHDSSSTTEQDCGAIPQNESKTICSGTTLLSSLQRGIKARVRARTGFYQACLMA